MGKVRRVSDPALPRMRNFAKEVDTYNCKVGWFAGNVYPNGGPPVAYIAAIQEYGAPSQGIPPRPTMRPTIAEESGEWSNTMGAVAKRVVKGQMRVYQAFDAVGLQAATDVQKTMAKLLDPPLSPVTILARKHKMDGGTIGSFSDVHALRAKLAAMSQNGPPNITGVSTKPLIDTDKLHATLTHAVEKE